MSSPSLSELQLQYAQFITERKWDEFQTPKNIAEALSIEANELLECFLWHDNLDADIIADHPNLVSDVEEELADILIYSLGMAEQLDIDLITAVETKLADNEDRFTDELAESHAEELREYQR